MAAMPAKMLVGVALGLLGGVIALVTMSIAWDGTLECMPIVGLNMLVCVMFFAVAGAFTKYAPVQGRTVLVLAIVCEIAVLLSALYEATYLWVSVVLAIFGIVCILVGACPTVSRWVDAERL